MSVIEDELYAQMYDQMLARRGGARSASSALAKMQALDPAINPPPAPRTVTPPLTTQPARSRQGGPAPVITALSSKPAALPMTRVGRAGTLMPVVGASAGPQSRFQQGPAGPGRGRSLQTSPLPAAIQSPPAPSTATTPLNPLNPLNGNVATAIQSGSAAALPSSAPVLSAQETPLAAPPSADPLGKITRKGSSFSALDDAGTVTLADARNAGKSGYGLSVIGMGLSPEGTVAKLKDQTEQARQLNRMKQTGLSESELAKVDARRAKDSEIYQLSQAGFSPRQAAGSIFQRDAALARQTAETPNQIAAGQQALLAGEQGLQKGALELQQGEAAAQTLQAKRAIAEQLGALDPADTKGRSALIDQLLAYDSQVQTPAKSLGYGVYTDLATGATVPYSKDTGVSGQQGGGLAGTPPPPEHIAMLQGNPAMAAQFEEAYGPGSAAQYLTK